MANNDQAREAIEKAGRRLRDGEFATDKELGEYDAVLEQFDIEGLWRRIGRTVNRAGRRRRVAVVVAGVAAAAVLIVVTLQLRRESPIYSDPAAAVSIAVGGGPRVSVERGKAEIALGGGALRNDTLAATLYYESVAAPDDQVQTVTLTVPRGGGYSIVLPDGTMVWLNSSTTLRFPDRFGTESRELELDGEAFFEVAPDRTRPLRVRAGGYEVVATGTEFNVEAYSGSGRVAAALMSGVVEIGGTTLAPGQICVVDTRDGAMETSEADIGRVAEWREGKVRFVGWTMERITAKMALWYDFEIVYTDPAIAAMRFSGTIDKRQSLNELLALIEQTGSLRFDIDGRRVTASGR